MPDLKVFGRRERVLRARAHGRVLDLAARASEQTDLSDLVAAGEKFDSVVSVFGLSRSRRPMADARAVEQLLSGGGEFFFLEATAAPGLAGAVRRALGGSDHDILAILREAGFWTSGCDHLKVATSWPPRLYVDGVAIRAPIDAAADTGAGA